MHESDVVINATVYCKKNYCRKLNISHKANAQSTIVKRNLNNIFEIIKSISVKNPGAHLTLEISTNQGFGNLLPRSDKAKSILTQKAFEIRSAKI